MVGMYFTKSTTSIRGTVNPKWWSFLRRLEQSGTAITFVIRCLNHIACHYIIIFKHQQMWCNITGIISPCEKNPSTSVTRATFKENKQNWLESGCQGPQWRWIGLDDILTPLGWGNKRRHTAEKAKKIHFLCFCNSELIFHCISSHSIYCTCIYVFFLNWPLNWMVFVQSCLGCFSFILDHKRRKWCCHHVHTTEWSSSLWPHNDYL